MVDCWRENIGALGGVIGGVMSVKEGLETRERHKFIGWAGIGLGAAEIGAAMLMLIAGTAGIGFIIGLVIAISMTVKSWIKPNAIRDWLSDTIYGSKEKVWGEKFRFGGLAQQEMALTDIGGGG
ncbi:hypothetical protein [Burkholderia thailandensis]|uniref:hypothetical protein n=1 Tax=Burkholderia thailandensis TaxID=57975 RepID=UPI0022AC3B81|nr:hypothetical protein [Burkholderia thailandensis]MCZ2902774.1 hypothetical protein [Burkholderia thailandensis]